VNSTATTQLYKWLLPPKAFPLVVAWLLLLPLSLLGGKQLLEPLMGQADQLLHGEALSLPLLYYIKAGTFGLLAILGVGQIWLRLQLVYTSAWASYYERPHPLHVDFHPEVRYSFLALLKWLAYRFIRIVLPSIITIASVVLLLWVELTLFSWWMDTPLFRLPLFFILALFLTQLAGLFALIISSNGLWEWGASCYGSCIAITEPFKTPTLVFNRSLRIIKQTKLIWGYHLGLWGFSLLSGAGVFGLFWFFDLHDVVTSFLPWGSILAVEGCLFIAWAGLGFFRFFAYVQALKNYYAQLPLPVKEAFSPPASLVSLMPTTQDGLNA
jgi:hypothetical protein